MVTMKDPNGAPQPRTVPLPPNKKSRKKDSLAQRRNIISVVHARATGRLRIEVAGLYRNASVASELEKRLRALDYLDSFSVSHVTGRVLLTFSKAMSHATVLARVSATLSSEVSIDRQSPGHPSPAPRKRTVSAKPALAIIGSEQSNQHTPTSPDELGRETHQPRNAESTHQQLWHTMCREAVVAALKADPRDGLSGDEAVRRLRYFGPNRTPGRPPTSPLTTLAKQFTSLPVGLLLGASATSILTGGVLDAFVTLAVVGANAAIGFSTESGSERIIRDMTARQPYKVPVVRNGVEQFILYDQIVPGDILVLRPNIVIAADARVIDAKALSINEALLTGESEPSEKSATHVCHPAEPLPDRSNMIFTGSFVASGTGRAIVVATGTKTESGRIESATATLETPRTPLERDLSDLGTKLAFVSLVACGAFFGAGYFRGRPLLSMLKSSIALAVAAVPEGLPATATTTLALGLQELRRKGVITRRLEAVESLGSLQVLCFDKTGTLTENRMRVDQIHLGIDGLVTSPTLVPTAHSYAAKRLLEIGTLCSEVTVEGDAKGLRAVGTPTEAALVTQAIEAGVLPSALRARLPLVRMQYRTETERYMISVHKSSRSNQHFLAAKGDPQQLLARCDRVLHSNGRAILLTDRIRGQILRTNDDLGGRGLRVLGFAFADGPEAKINDKKLVWVGAAGLKDPVAPGAKELVDRLHTAGIRPVMITGDQSTTAQAIATEIGLSRDGSLRVLDSSALDRLRPGVLSAIAQRTHVFARVPPTKKLRIVEALQKSGLTVGMTGDGFNDAPALKASNTSIAVGRDTASVARDVADVIVSADNLTVIADGIEQGRTILSNIRKSVHYMISTNLSEIIVLLAESLSHNDELETPMELLWLNLVTDILPALGLAMEPPERHVMKTPPRAPGQSLLTLSDLRHATIESGVISASVLGAHAYALAKYGPGPNTRGITFMSLVISQLLHALSCRHDRFEPLGGRTLFGNPALNAALFGATALQSLPLASAGLRRILGIAAPTTADLAVAGLTGMGSFLANEAILAWRTSAGSIYSNPQVFTAPNRPLRPPRKKSR